MRSTGSQFLTRLYCLTLIMAFLWLGGVGCTTCCASEQMILPATGRPLAAPSLPTTNETASCTTEMDCCKKAAKSRAATGDAINDSKPASEALEISESSGVAACRLLPKHSQGFVTLKFAFAHLAADLPVSGLPFISTDRENSLSVSHLALPRNRSGTYLRCCVFLI